MADPSSEKPSSAPRFTLRSLLAVQFTVAGVSFLLAREQWASLSPLLIFVILAGGLQAAVISRKKRAAVMGGFASAIAFGFFQFGAFLFAPLIAIVLSLPPSTAESIVKVAIVGACTLASIIGGIAGARVISEADRYRAITLNMRRPG